MKHLIVTAAALLLSSCQAEDGSEQVGSNKAAETTLLEPGQWLITVVSANLNYSGARSGARVPSVRPGMESYCLAAGQANRPEAAFFTGGIQGGRCSYDEFSIADGRISGLVRCEGGDVWLRATLTGRYSRTRYDVTIEGEMGTPGVTAEFDAQMMGERFGDC